MSDNVKVAILLAGLFLPAMLLSQGLNLTVTDSTRNEKILYGYCDRSGLEKGDFGKLFDEYYGIYKPDQAVIKQLKLKKEGVEIVIVLGTWCSDSQEQVPKFFKILDKIRFDDKKVKLICVNGKKEAPGKETADYNIKKVPTFIIFRNGKEIGRIVETPYATLEKDLLMFFND